MAESLEDVYKVNETWEQSQMGVGNESTFLQKNLIGRAIWERKYFIGIAQYKDGVELELMKYSLSSSRMYYTELGLFTVLFCSVRRFWHICLALFPRGRASRHKTLLNFPFPKGFLRPSLCRVLTARDKPARPFEYFP